MHKEGALFPLATARHKYEIDMCTGSLPQKILLFSLPLMATGMLQLLFNAADIIVVGRYVGSHALAAVGSNGSIINLIVNLFMGISIGGSAVIAQHYGAAQYEDVSEATHTCMLVGLISGFFVMVVGVVCTPAILRLMDTPDDVLPLAILYLRIYFLGMPGSMLYNFGAAVLRGVGDTRRPLIFLFFAGIVNVGLNLLLVIQFNLSVAGVGIATVVSQYISAALVLWCMLKTDGCYHIVLKELRIHRDKLIRILKIGIPAGLQGAIFSISNVLIQSSINSFGSTAMAGNAAAVNIEGFVFTSCNSVAQASLTFTSQNLGAGQYKRLRGITLWCLALGILLSEILGFIAYGFGNSLLAFYNKDSEVIAMGMIRMMIVGTTYGLDAIMDIMADIIRGMGSSVMPMIVTLIGACGFRVVWIYTIFATHHDLRVLYISYPISWILTSLTHIICYFIVKRRRLSGLRREFHQYEPYETDHLDLGLAGHPSGIHRLRQSHQRDRPWRSAPGWNPGCFRSPLPRARTGTGGNRGTAPCPPHKKDGGYLCGGRADGELHLHPQ